MKAYVRIGLLSIVFSVVSCSTPTDWQAQYKTKLSELAQPIQEKIDFLKEACQKYESINDSCVCYKNADMVSRTDSRKILNALPEVGTLENYNDKSYLIIHSHAEGGICLDESYEFLGHAEDGQYNYDKFFSIDLEEESKMYYDNPEDRMKEILSSFEEKYTVPLSKLNYLLIVKDKILVKPDGERDGTTFLYDTGYILSSVEVYDLNTKQLINTFDMAAENSESLNIDLFKPQESLNKNLYSNLKKNIVTEFERRLQ